MGKELSYTNKPLLILGLIVILYVNISNWAIYQYIVNVPVIIIDPIFLLIIFVGAYFIPRYIDQKKNYLFFVRLTYYFLMLILLLLCTLIVFLVFIIESNLWFGVVRSTTVFISASTILLLSKIKPDVHTDEPRDAKNPLKIIFLKTVIIMVQILILSIPIILWLFLYVFKVVKDEGVSILILFIMLALCSVPFSSMISTIHLVQSKKTQEKNYYWKANLKRAIPVIFFTISCISFSVGSVMSKYLQVGLDISLAVNITFYSVAVIASFSFLILVLLIQKQLFVLKKVSKEKIEEN